MCFRGAFLLTDMLPRTNAHGVAASELARLEKPCRDRLKRERLVGSRCPEDSSRALMPEIVHVLVQLSVDLGRRGPIVMAASIHRPLALVGEESDLPNERRRGRADVPCRIKRNRAENRSQLRYGAVGRWHGGGHWLDVLEG